MLLTCVFSGCINYLLKTKITTNKEEHAMVKIIKLEAETFSEKCRNEIIGHIPHVVGWRKLNVPSSGDVFYLKNKNGNTIAHVYKDNGGMILSMKEVT